MFDMMTLEVLRYKDIPNVDNTIDTLKRVLLGEDLLAELVDMIMGILEHPACNNEYRVVMQHSLLPPALKNAYLKGTRYEYWLISNRLRMVNHCVHIVAMDRRYPWVNWMHIDSGRGYIDNRYPAVCMQWADEWVWS